MTYHTAVRYNKYVRQFCTVMILNEKKQTVLEQPWILEAEIPKASADLMRLTNYISCDSHKNLQ